MKTRAVRCIVMCALAASMPATAQTVVATVQVGVNPVAVAINPATNKIYVVNQSSNSVSVIDGTTYQTATVPTGLAPDAIAVNSITNKIYVANGDSGTVTIIDGQTNGTSTVNVGVYPFAIAVNTATNIIYVANNVSSTVTAINGVSLHTTNIGVGRRPRALAINLLTNQIYCANSISNDVTVIDGATNATTPIAVGVTPVAIAVSQTSNQIYVANYSSSSLSVIDGRTMSVTPVSTGVGPGALAVDPVANRIYVANAADNSTTIVNLTTLQTTTIAVGASPTGVEVDLFTNKVYFTNMVQQGTVTMLNGQDYSITSVDVGHYPIAIATNAARNRIYVVNNGSNTVSVLGGGTSDALQFKAITPCRLVDTRSSPGPFGGPAIAGGTWRSFAPPQGPCNVPSTAAAYSLNVTVVPHGALGYLTAWPAGEAQPTISTLNSLDGRVKANAAIVPAGTAGAVSIYASQTTDVVLDINGYFQVAAADTLQFYPVSPCRVLDTRSQNGYLGGPYLHKSSERDFAVLASDCHIPDTAQVYVMNFTVVPWHGQRLGYLTVWAAGGEQPLVSTLNNPTATIVANTAIVPAGFGGAIAVYPDQETHLVADISGYFAAPAVGLSLYPSAPCRVLDTRSTGGAFSGRRSAPVDVLGSPCGIPSNAQAFVLNVTAVPVGSLGYLTLWPDGQTMPLASTLNAVDAAITSNMAVLPNQNGKLDAYASGATQMVIDISSYFAP